MKKLAPYQIFFPLGFINALLAVGVWFVQDLNWFASPAIFIHSRLIAGGFLWSFITGFLMTALPRMSGTESAHKVEYTLASILLLGLSVFAWQTDLNFFYYDQILLIIFLLLYGIRRLIRMTKPLPVFFSHVGIAMVLALTGSYAYLRGNTYVGIHLYHLGSVLLLILGIGTRFFSFLSGLPSTFENESSHGLRILFHLLGLSVGILLYSAASGLNWAYLGLTLISCFYLLKIWSVQRPSSRPSALKYALRFVSFMIPLSFFMTWLFPLMYITWFHLLFIGCFSLITFSVATRVTLAHGAYSTDFEMRSRALWGLLIFLLLGLSCRIAYGLTDALWKKSFLHLAATFWVIALLCWGWVFIPKIFISGPQLKPSC